MQEITIDARQAVDFIRAGLDNETIMRQFGISERGLRSLLVNLVAAGAVRYSDLSERINSPDAGEIVVLKNLPRIDAIEEPRPRPKPDSKQCLVISQDPRLVLAVLEEFKSNQDVTFAHSEPSRAEEALQEMMPDLILMDVDESRAASSQMLRLTKGLDRFVPAIAILSRGNEDSAPAALKKGAYDVVYKPFEAEMLQGSVKRGLEHCDLARFRQHYRSLMEEELHNRTLLLSQTKEFLQSILDSSTLVSVILTDLEQNVLFWNKGAENIFGYTSEEMVGEKVNVLYPTDVLSKHTVQNLRNLARSDRGTVYGKMEQRTKSGNMLTISLAITPMHSSKGEVRGILGMGLDSTEEVRQQKEILGLLDQVRKTQDAAIFSLAKLAESRDEETGSHLLRIQQYCRVLCERLAEREHYQDLITRDFIDDLVRSSVLHDVGKVGIPDSILMFSGKFGPTERSIMERHSEIGGRALEEAVERLGDTSFLSIGSEIAYYHHERWDGTGYPRGLKREEIPISARVVAIADVYDALTTERRYKKALAHETAISIISEGKGNHFDPGLVEVLEEVESEFRGIRDSCLNDMKESPGEEILL